MNAKKRVFLFILILSIAFPKHISANQYEEKLVKVNSKIRCTRTIIRMDRQFIRRLKDDIEMFKKLEEELENKAVCNAYKSYLINQKNKTKKNIKKHIKKLKKYLKKQKKLKHKIKYIKEHSYNGVLLQYKKPYNVSKRKLNKRDGVCYYNGHRETYYSQRVLTGGGLNIPDRHVAEDGTIRDKDGYICVASNPSFYPKGSKLMISLGPAKVYDCGCAYGTIDVYCDW